jgi:DNA ligase-1
VGKGKFANVPIFKCKLSNGKTFDVAPRGSDAVRVNLLKNAKSMVGKPYTVRHFGFTDEGVPRFPVGIGLREKGT